MTIGRCALLRSVSLHSSHCSVDPNLFLFIVTSNIASLIEQCFCYMVRCYLSSKLNIVNSFFHSYCIRLLMVYLPIYNAVFILLHFKDPKLGNYMSSAFDPSPGGGVSSSGAAIGDQWWYSQFWDYENWGLCIREMWPLHTFTDKAFDVEVFVLDPERLPFAGLPTVLTGDRSSSSLLLLLQWAVDSLLLKHCRRQRQFQISFLYRIIHRSYTERESWQQTKWHFYLLDFVKHLANPNNRN